MSLGECIRGIRHQRGLSQWELSRLSGLTRSHLSRLELDNYSRPSAKTFLALARGLHIHPNTLYEAAGYGVASRGRRGPPGENNGRYPELELVLPTPVRALNNFKAILEDMNRVYISNEKANKLTVVGVLANGFSLEPCIHEGDVILVDRARPPAEGNIVLECLPNHVQLVYYHAMAGPDDSRSDTLYGVVVGVNRSLI